MTDLTVFDKAFERLMDNEGGYVNHPLDPGQETMYGVTKRVAVDHGYRGDMRKLPKSLARDIAKKSYWDKSHCDRFDPRVATQLFDASYNHGPVNAIKFLQRAAGLNEKYVDGIIGSQTIGAVNQFDPNIIVLRFLSKRLDFFTRLGTWKTFGKGWARRVAEQLESAAMDLQ